MLIDGPQPFANVEADRPANIRNDEVTLTRFALRSDVICRKFCRNDDEVVLRDMVVDDKSSTVSWSFSEDTWWFSR